MKAAVVFTGTGPILVLSSYDSFTDTRFVQKMAQKGIEKFIACDVDVALCQKKYGQKFDAVLKDVKQENDLRVLDYNGHNVFYNFAFSDLGSPLFVDSKR